MRLIILTLFYSLSLFFVKGQGGVDSVMSRSSLFVIPHMSYQQETSFALGIAGGYYFKSNSLKHISSISGSAVYTFLHQFIFNVTPKIYFGQGKWFLYSNLNIKNYPDYYYGVGNSAIAFKQGYVSQHLSLLMQPQLIVSKQFFIGPSFSFRSDRISGDSLTLAAKTEIHNSFGSAGWEPFSQLSCGIIAAYDTRDNQFYPQSGFFAKSTIMVSDVRFGSSYSLQAMTFDFRQYIPIFASHIVAWQLYGDAVFGKSAIPFQLLPTLGGRDVLRGFRQGRYRQNVLLAAQAEYRMPVYKRLKAAFFLASGDVVNSDDCSVDKLKFAYGLGLRYRLNDARVHLRVDLAKNNYGDKLQFYITATEAF